MKFTFNNDMDLFLKKGEWIFGEIFEFILNIKESMAKINFGI